MYICAIYVYIYIYIHTYNAHLRELARVGRDAKSETRRTCKSYCLSHSTPLHPPWGARHKIMRACKNCLRNGTMKPPCATDVHIMCGVRVSIYNTDIYIYIYIYICGRRRVPMHMPCPSPCPCPSAYGHVLSQVAYGHVVRPMGKSHAPWSPSFDTGPQTNGQ